MQPTQAARHAEGECKGGGRYARHYNAVANHYCMKELKIEHIEKPKGISNSPCHIIPYLPMGGGYSSIVDIGHTATPTIYYLLQLQHEFQQTTNNFLKLWTIISISPKN